MTIPIQKTDCPFCGPRRLPVMLGRTSAACVADALRAMVPDLHSRVGQSVKGLQLKHSKLTTRLLRTGFMYKFERRDSIVGVTGYYVTPGAFYYRFDVDSPPISKPAFTCDINTCGINASCLDIELPEFCDRAWFMFSPDPVTPSYLKQIKAGPDSWEKLGVLKGFSPKAWIGGSRAQQHTIPAEELAAWVAEYRCLAMGGPFAGGKPLNDVLDSQLFPPLRGAEGDDQWLLEPHKGRLQSVQALLAKLQGVFLVLDDPIGIAQETNDARNAQIESLDPWLRTADDRGYTNEYKFQIGKALLDAKDTLEKGTVVRAEQRIALAEPSAQNSRAQRLQRAALMRASGREVEAQAIEQEQKRIDQVRAKNRDAILAKGRDDAKVVFDKYLPHLRWDELNTHQGTVKTQTDNVQKNAEPYAADHIACLNHNALLNAFLVYDQTDAAAGIAFAAQIGVMVAGMGGTHAGETHVLKWLRDTAIADTNWLLRGVALNNAQLKAETSTLLSRLAAVPPKQDGSPDWGGLEKVALALKGVPDLMDKMIDAVEESGHGGGWFQRNALGKAMFAYVPLMQGALRLGNPAIGERKLMQAYMGLLSAHMGKLGREARLWQLAGMGHGAQTVQLEKAEAQIKKDAHEVLNRQMSNARRSDFYKIRMVSLIAGFEALSAFAKFNNASKTQADARFYMETAAAAVGVTAAMLEIVAQGTELAMEKLSKSTKPLGRAQAAAAVATGGMKLWAGHLAGAAGMVGAAFDFVDSYERVKRDKYLLSLTYASRGVANAGISVFTAIIGTSYSGPFLKHIAQRTGNAALQRTLQSAASSAFALAKQRAKWMVRLARWSWAGIALTVLIWALDENDLIQWCQKSAYRKDMSNPGYKNFETEQEELMSAIEEVN